jgi:hypothetical protein
MAYPAASWSALRSSVSWNRSSIRITKLQNCSKLKVRFLKGENMQLIEPGDRAEFDAILRRHHLAQSDFSLTAIDTTDPKTDELSGLQGELTVTRLSTGQVRQYLISDSTSWLDLFRHDITDRVYIGQENNSRPSRTSDQSS